MSQAHDPRALEGYIALEMVNASSAVQQIRTGDHPQYDDNCRRDIGECLLSIAVTRERQVWIEPTYSVGAPLQIAGLREDDLPGDMTVSELRRVRRFVCLPQ